MAPARQYTDDDIKAIIGRALESQAGGKGAVTHADLLAIGEQVGISPAAMEGAAREVLDSRLDAEARRRILGSRKRWLIVHAAVFAVINALLFTVNALTTPGEWWALFSVVFWGLFLGLHAGVALGAGVSARRQKRERARLEAEQNVRSQRQLRVEPALEGAAPDDQEASAEPELVSRADK
jgi:hypothetical protein